MRLSRTELPHSVKVADKKNVTDSKIKAIAIVKPRWNEGMKYFLKVSRWKNIFTLHKGPQLKEPGFNNRGYFLSQMWNSSQDLKQLKSSVQTKILWWQDSPATLLKGL